MAVLEDTPERKVFELSGHRVTVERTDSGRRWHMRCTCGRGQPKNRGHKPRTYAVFRVAMAEGIGHVKKAEARARADARRNGLRDPGPGPSTTLGEGSVRVNPGT